MPPPGKYDELRQAEQQVETASQGRTAPEIDSSREESTRPTDYPASPRSWPESADMVSQQTAAMEWAKQSHAGRQEAAAAPAPQENGQDIRAIAEAAWAREQAGRERQQEQQR